MNVFYQKSIDELLTLLPENDCCVKAFLSAYAKAAGYITRSGGRNNVRMTAADSACAAALVALMKKLYPTQFEINAEHIKSGSKKGGVAYWVQVPSGYTSQMLADAELMSSDGSIFTGFKSEVPDRLTRANCCAANYLKGLYLACGSVYVPSLSSDYEKKDGYHFELQFSDEAFAENVRDFTENRFGINAKLSERGSNYLVYVKDKGEILSLLGVMGLGECALTLKDIIDERETANSINRASICEAANMDKTCIAASRQTVAIGIIEERIGLDSLSLALREAADARLDNPTASLAELAELVGVSKNCLNHRFRKLIELASTEGDEI